MNRYQYTFNGVVAFNGRDCYEVGFRTGSRTRERSTQGTMWIDKETLAYVAFEIDRLDKSNARQLMGFIFPVEDYIKVVYELHNGKWYSTRVSKKAKHENVRLPFPSHANIDMIVTHIQTDSVKPIPVESRLEYTDRIQTKVETFNPKGWTDSDILAHVQAEQLGFQFSIDESAELFQQKVSPKSSSANLRVALASKLILSYGVSYTPIRFNEVNPNIHFQSNQDIPPFVFSQTMPKADANFHLQFVVGYRIDKKWHLFWQSGSNLFNEITYNSNSLGITFRRNLNKAGYPLFIGASFLASDRSYYRNLGSRENPNSFRYNNKNFNAKELRFDYGVREQTIAPQLSLSKRMSRLITLDVYAGYHFSVHSQSSLRIKEKGGIPLFRKSTTVHFDDNHVSPNQWEAGLRFFLF
ncbi:MAG: hypothetical protein FWE99_03080 [Bacteroidales bacterium]|nr:hypothetical protein [Bacteroidales bacterium]